MVGDRVYGYRVVYGISDPDGTFLAVGKLTKR